MDPQFTYFRKQKKSVHNLCYYENQMRKQLSIERLIDFKTLHTVN